MSGANTLGGLLSIIGGLFILIETLIIWSSVWTSTYPMADVVNLGIGLAAIIGGVFGIKGQRGAGGLSLVVGLLSIVLGLLTVYALQPNVSFLQFSLIADQFKLTFLYDITNISLEAIIIAVGGILILAGGEK